MKANINRSIARFGLLAGALLAMPAYADINDLLDMSEKLDKIEKQDFGDAIDKANACTRARDFACTNLQLGKAGKLANGSRDKQMLAAAQQNMANEKARIAEEARLRAEEERRIAEAEERLRVAEAEAARRASQSSEPSTGAQLFQLGMAIAGNVYAEKARLAAAAASSGRSQSGGLPLADLSAERQRVAQLRAEAASARQAREQASRTQVASSTISSGGTAARAAPQAAASAAPTLQAPQVFVSAGRESCPPGMSQVTSSSGTACVANTQGGSGQATTARSAATTGPGGSVSSSTSAGAAGASNTGGSYNAAGSSNASGNSNTGGYPTPASTQTRGSSSTPAASSSTRVATTGGGSSATGGGYPNVDPSSGGAQPKKLYPLIRHFTFPTLGFTEQQGCAEAEKKVEEQYSRSYNQSRMVNRGSCSCTKEKDIYGTIYQCKIPVTDELMVDYDPNKPTSNTSR